MMWLTRTKSLQPKYPWVYTITCSILYLFAYFFYLVSMSVKHIYEHDVIAARFSKVFHKRTGISKVSNTLSDALFQRKRAQTRASLTTMGEISHFLSLARLRDSTKISRMTFARFVRFARFNFHWISCTHIYQFCLKFPKIALINP